MAYDKVVDSTELDTALSALADAIRTKTGGASELSFPGNGMKNAVNSIVTLSEGSADADATAADILFGKTAYVNGVKITGTLSGSGYHLEGEWTFTSNLHYSTSTVINETINFYLMAAGMAGDSFTSMRWDNGVLTYTNAGGTSYTVYSAYNDEWSYPVTGDSKNINFGTTPQQVSEEFYNWFTYVATLNSGTSTSYTVSGAYQFNIDALQTYYASSTDTIEQTVNFTSNGTSYTAISASSGSIQYMYSGGSVTVATPVMSYFDEAYRTIDFGADSQEVSEVFYNWIRTVAEPIEPIVIPEGVTLVYNGSEPLGAISSDGTQITRLESGSIRVAYNTPIIFYDGMGNGLLSPSFSSSSVQTESMYWGNVYYVSDSHDGSSITISY